MGPLLAGAVSSAVLEEVERRDVVNRLNQEVVQGVQGTSQELKAAGDEFSSSFYKEEAVDLKTEVQEEIEENQRWQRCEDVKKTPELAVDESIYASTLESLGPAPSHDWESLQDQVIYLLNLLVYFS